MDFLKNLLKKGIWKVFLLILILLIVLYFVIINNINNKNDIYKKDTILVASFNALRLGESKKDYNKMAIILSNYDLIGLQEVMNEKGIRKLKYHLENVTNIEWDYIISNHSVGSENYQEYYGFLYKKNVFSEAKSLGYYKEKDNNEFMREPFACFFKAGDFDFVYILAHSIFGDKEARRLIEASNYSNVYTYFKKSTKEKDIILAGDFNLPANDKAFQNLKIIHNVDYVLNPQLDLTTISDNNLANSYDNFFLNFEKTTEFTGRYGVHNFVKDNKYKESKSYISDHLVIFTEYNIRKGNNER